MAVFNIISKDASLQDVDVEADYVELNVDFFEFYNRKENKVSLVAYYSSSMVYSVTETPKRLKAV